MGLGVGGGCSKSQTGIMHHNMYIYTVYIYMYIYMSVDLKVLVLSVLGTS